MEQHMLLGREQRPQASSMHEASARVRPGLVWLSLARLGPSLAALGDLNTWDDALEEFDDIVGSWGS